MSEVQRYRTILSSGAFTKLSPPELHTLYNEVEALLDSSLDKLDSIELFDLYELQFFLLLLTTQDIKAKAYLDRINDQFSSQRSQKILIMKLMYYEAIGDVNKAMDALGKDPDELRASRRLATFSRKGNNAQEYITSLNYYLDLQPSDLVAWAELADNYAKVGHYDKAVFCCKEVLLQEPNAYNIFYKVGLYLYYQYLQEYKESDKKDKLLAAFEKLESSRDAFLRSVEISESYTKSWVGVYTVSGAPILTKLQKIQSKKVEQFADETQKLRALSKQRIMDLEQIATDKEFLAFLQTSQL